MSDLTGNTPALLRQQLKVLEKQRKTAISAINTEAEKKRKDLEAQLKDHERNGKPANKRLGRPRGQKPAAAPTSAQLEASKEEARQKAASRQAETTTAG